ncbi:MAG: DeoR/GlpR family DNA-binding transcription regulator [Nocardioides sp.]|uniref:DeoR/GlpR family DNA-binding transcription regulator n=1 Tax=Nocardioides sp. TaxID=35761 RepID=UPI0039E2C65B
MLSLERQRRVLQLLRENGSGNVADLAQSLGVSASTVRRDLREMDDRGLLSRVHGGASLLNADLEPGLMSRSIEHSDEKRRIGEAAAARVPDDSTVLITGGTTTEAMLPFLAGRQGITVLTNGLSIATHLSIYPEISVVVLGGVLRHEEMSLLGRIAEQALAEFQVDVAFSSAYAMSAEHGLSGAHVNEAGTDRRMLQTADRLVVLADSTKFARRGPVRLASVDQIDCLVTDSATPSDDLDTLRGRGVEVVIA